MTWQDLHADVIENAEATKEALAEPKAHVKEPRMTTNKRKKGNYYAEANVKNRRK